MKKIIFLALFVMMAVMATNAYAVPTANWGLGGGNPYWGDYDIILGVYDSDNATTLWSQRLATSYSSNPSSGTVDLTAAESYLAGHRWYLDVDDNWGANASYLQIFNIVTSFGTFGADGLPVYIPDHARYVATIDIPSNGNQDGNPVPEPMTMLLFGPALLGLLGLKKKK